MHIGTFANVHEASAQGVKNYGSLGQVTNRDSLPVLAVEVNWLKTKKFPSLGDLQEQLGEKEAEGIHLPDTKQVLQTDPRLISKALLKDTIRRQFCYAAYGMNIYSLVLEYDEPKGTQTIDVLNTDWTNLQSTFSDTATTNLALQVVFEVLDNADTLFKCTDEAPLEIQHLFNIKDGEISFSNASQPQTSDDENATNNEQKPSTLASYLSIPLAEGSTRDVFKQPDLRKRFPSDEAFFA